MAIDLSRVATKAIEAALEDGHERRRGGSTVRALAAGAALAVGARAAMTKAPGPAKFALSHLPGLSELRDVPERIRDRMTDAGWLDDDEPVEDEPEAYEDDEEPEAEAQPDDDEDFEEDEDEDDEELDDDEPEAEADDELDDEDVDDEPDAEADEDFDDEGDDDDEDEDEEPAPELEIQSEDDDDLHPEDRPPKPPRSKSTSGR